jgi:hypothetical protein
VPSAMFLTEPSRVLCRSSLHSLCLLRSQLLYSLQVFNVGAFAGLRHDGLSLPTELVSVVDRTVTLGEVICEVAPPCYLMSSDTSKVLDVPSFIAASCLSAPLAQLMT